LIVVKGKLLIACLILFASTVAGTAGAHQSAPSPNAVISTRGVIKKLAADGTRFAVVTTARRGKCGAIVVWTAPGRRSTSLGARGCPSLLCPAVCVNSLALGAGRVAWETYDGGNDLELAVWTTGLSGRAAKQIDFVTNHNGAGGDPDGGYVGPLFGAGVVLAYNQWTICEATGDPHAGFCSPVDPVTHHVLAKDQLKLVSAAGKSVVVRQGADAYRLDAVGGGRIAVQSAGEGDITVLAPSGEELATVLSIRRDPPRAIALSKKWLAVERKSTLDLVDPSNGVARASITLGTEAPLLLGGVNSTLVMLRSAKRLVLVRLSDGKRQSLTLQRGTKPIVDARLTEAGLFYAYNVPRASAKGRIVFEPTAKLLARF